MAVWSQKTRILIDCGLKSMKRTRLAMQTAFGGATTDAVFFTHMHGDHCSYYPLRVLQESGVQVRVHEASVAQMRDRHCERGLFDKLRLKPFVNKKFQIGDLEIQAFEVPHQPALRTFGFEIRHREKDGWRKAVVAADFYDSAVVLPYLVDADFIYLESNHDLQLLRMYPNPNSQFHLSNLQAAQVLCEARQQSSHAPQAVMLGHLSDERNETTIAVRETFAAFENAGIEADFDLCAAPLFEPGEIVAII